jgi:GT2 family glycosyltransferase
MTRVRSLTVAIPSWNGKQHLATCLPALAAQRAPGVPWRVVVLDNGSSDGSVAWLRAAHPGVEVIESPSNLGFCVAMNRLVAASDADAVALLNNDTRPEPDWLQALHAALASAPDDVAAVSGRIVDWGGERLDFGRGLMTFDGHAFQLDYQRPLALARCPAAGDELLFACGGNMLVRRETFLALGGFDEDYFAYLEDVDLGWRMWSAGHRVVAAPDAMIHHRSMATSALLGADHRGFLFERNAYLTAYKNYEDGLWQQIMPAVLLTLQHRTQTLLVQNNPGGEVLTIDPYAGHIADTRPCPDAAPRRHEPPLPLTPAGMLARWQRYGTRDLLRRGARKALAAWSATGSTRGRQSSAAEARITDGRTVAQLRAITYILGHLDQAAERRAAVQALRRRSDQEILGRFPVAVVPTYPGDDRLFSSDAFDAWLPDSLPVQRLRLDEVMNVSPRGGPSS